MTGGSVARSVITHITRLIWYDQVSSTRPGPSLPVAVVPWLIALVTSSDAIRTASEISGSRCHFRSAVVVNSRATLADSGTGGSVMPTCLSVVAASIDVGASHCPSPWRRSLTCVEAICCPWYMDQPPSLMLGASAKGQRMRYDATSGVQMQVHLHRHQLLLEVTCRGTPGNCLFRACLDRSGAGTGRLERVSGSSNQFMQKSRKGCTVDLAYGGIWPLQLPGAEWQKSSYSNPSGNCVEMARLPAGQVAVRDSKRPGDPVLVFTWAEWSAFVTALRTAHACLPLAASAARLRAWHSPPDLDRYRPDPATPMGRRACAGGYPAPPGPVPASARASRARCQDVFRRLPGPVPGPPGRGASGPDVRGDSPGGRGVRERGKPGSRIVGRWLGGSAGQRGVAGGAVAQKRSWNENDASSYGVSPPRVGDFRGRVFMGRAHGQSSRTGRRRGPDSGRACRRRPHSSADTAWCPASAASRGQTDHT